MKKIFFLLNNEDEFDFESLILKYLKNVSVNIGSTFPDNSEEYDMIILWSYRRIIPNLESKKNVIVFHSSDLPNGKGWSPIYYTLAQGVEHYTISGILASNDVDSGDLLAKARFKIRDNHTASFIRKWDHEICIRLIAELLVRFDGKKFRGIKQQGEGSYFSRRYPTDNEISIYESISKNFNHVRGCEKNHPAFFWFNNTKYNLYIEPDSKPDFPSDLEIVFFGGGV